MIEVSAVTKRYGGLTVLDGIDFAVASGEIAAVVGPSGAGKSTLARCINLLERPTAGSIRVAGQDLTALTRKQLRVARRAIGTVFQSAGLLARLTAAENVALPLRYFDIPHAERARRVRRLLERVDMLHRANYYPAQLSGGQQQRIGLARGLVLNPAVLLADEPTSGLDPQTTSSILALLSELRSEFDVAVVLITHEMDVVRTVADTVAQLDHGRIVERGAVSEVVRRSDSALARALLPEPAVPIADGSGEMWHVRYESTRADATWLSAVSRQLDTDIALLSGLVETVGGETAGRAVVRMASARPEAEIRAAFRARGLHAEREGARALELDATHGSDARGAASALDGAAAATAEAALEPAAAHPLPESALVGRAA